MNNNYADKVRNAELAQEHTKRMDATYKREIEQVLLDTRIYDEGFSMPPSPAIKVNTRLVDCDSVTAIMNFSSGKTAVLNFASFKNPGGRFLEGSMAQEESLCQHSFLYNVLSKRKDYYIWNGEHKNRALYANRALYTPQIRFFQGKRTTTCDVITCAAPNWKAANRYGMATAKENTKALTERILFILDVAKDQEVETFILGAFGCGVFGQDPYTVARIFKYYLVNTHKCFKNVIFAIPDKNSKNFTMFNEVLNCKIANVPTKPTSLFS